MNFKKYFKETADPEKITTNMTCSSCGKKLDHRDMQTYKIMNQGTDKLCLNCQKLLNKKVSDITKFSYDPSIKLDVWGKREQMF